MECRCPIDDACSRFAKACTIVIIIISSGREEETLFDVILANEEKSSNTRIVRFVGLRLAEPVDAS